MNSISTWNQFKRLANGDAYFFGEAAYEDGSTFLRIVAPGLKKKDLKVRVEGRKVNITVKATEDKDERNWVGLGIPQLRGTYTYHTVHNIKGDAVKADLSDGVLELELPNAEAQEGVDVKIN